MFLGETFSSHGAARYIGEFNAVAENKPLLWTNITSREKSKYSWSLYAKETGDECILYVMCLNQCNGILFIFLLLEEWIQVSMMNDGITSAQHGRIPLARGTFTVMALSGDMAMVCKLNRTRGQQQRHFYPWSRSR